MSDTDKRDEERRAKLVKAGVAVGIGSAAIVAALLYASTVKKKAKRNPTSGDATD
ncbi:MAG TPA: isopropylmalate isomerase [Sphingomicrobium sp.]|nr:isopropylmalate isomerase [Sphingomicrobium sp.]